MRKVVFNGVINGKEFDNVQDYNEEMNKLLQSGATNISASSSTSIVDEPETVAEPPEEDKKKPFVIEDYLPYFVGEGNDYYIDLLASEDDELNNKNLEIAEHTFVDVLKKLRDEIADRNITVEQAFDLVNLVKEVRARVDNDKDTNEKMIKDIEAALASKTKELKLLKNARPIINYTKTYYDELFKIMKTYLLAI